MKEIGIFSRTWKKKVITTEKRKFIIFLQSS